MTHPLTGELPKIILASTSIFRKQLLEKLGLPFDQLNPEINETPQTNESVQKMTLRLSREKAEAVAKTTSDSLIIGSDQSAIFQDQPIGKPHTHQNAFQQLKQFSGQSIEFLTGLAVIDQRTQQIYKSLDSTRVHFRHLSDQDIENYLRTETPYECAGSFKSEGLGITLFERIESKDPNALIGLPLIDLTTHLKACGIQLPLISHNKKN